MTNQAFTEPWLQTLVHTDTFFRPCPNCFQKSSGREVTVNFFDIDAPQPHGVCSLCMGQTPAHRMLQIRRSSYHDVVKVQDVAKLADIHDIQTYIINSSKVMFLKRRPQPRAPKGSTGVSQCVVCERYLQDANAFCSLQCKMDVVLAGGAIPQTLVKSAALALATPVSSGSHSQSPPGTPSRVEHNPGMIRDNHSSDLALSLEEMQRDDHSCVTSRRKGIPRRAPLW